MVEEYEKPTCLRSRKRGKYWLYTKGRLYRQIKVTENFPIGGLNMINYTDNIFV